MKGGCGGNFHIKVLQTHLASERHKRCAEHQKALAATPGTNPAERALEAMNHQDYEKTVQNIALYRKKRSTLYRLHMERGSSRSNAWHIARRNLSQ